RHLVNLPPNDINPATIEALIKKDLQFNAAAVKIDVWDAKKLDQENMHLHLAVGKGSDTPPRMVHIKYRPKKKSSKKPIAFVGKGITFDTGGLDIKPSAGMRLMKKDMGGAAAVIGLAYWAIQSKYDRACDFYLALAENSVDAKSMRPSDVYKSRAGFLVEIDNTDAEGRLVLADVMDVAAKQAGADAPEYLIDLATLTGAIKVALGADVAGLFSNDDKLATQLQNAGQATGEPNWRMPLVQKYFSSMSSNFADFKNSGEGFGGAITAALFLEKFCNGVKWAHLDIYSWTDKVQGPFAAAGASGQPVQSLIHWLKTQA
ncbi:MAG: leucyl aminopeptidase family protein, partial [Pseudobdellovibrio sp.]